MSEKNFTWIPIYNEFAKTLLNYKDDQSELIEKLKKAFQATALSFPKLIDSGEVYKIDPFTVMGMFNRGISESNRKAIIKEIKSLFNISETVLVPDDFNGIPILNNMHACFYLFDRYDTEDIDNLWKLFEHSMNNSIDDEFEKLFDGVLNQKGIGWNITMGLFWINPIKYLNLDSTNRWYISEKYKIKIKKLSWQNYNKAMTELKEKTDSKYYELSYIANEEIKKMWKPQTSPSINKDRWLENISNEILKQLYLKATSEKEISKDDITPKQLDGLLDLCKKILNEDGNRNIKFLECGFQYIAPGNNKASLVKLRFSDDLYELCKEKYNINSSTKESMKTIHNLNTIFYGPPGTGKTYHLAKKVLEINEYEYDEKKYKLNIKN